MFNIFRLPILLKHSVGRCLSFFRRPKSPRKRIVLAHGMKEMSMEIDGQIVTVDLTWGTQIPPNPNPLPPPKRTTVNIS